MPDTLLVFVISSNEKWEPSLFHSLAWYLWCKLDSLRYYFLVLNFDNQIQCGTVISWSIVAQIPTIEFSWPAPCRWDVGCLSLFQISNIGSISITANNANLIHSIFCFDMFFYVDDQVRYGAVITRSIFRPNPHNEPTTTHPWGRDKGYLLWVQPVIYVLLQPLYSFMRYHIKRDRATAAPDRISTHSSIVLHPSTTGCPTVLQQRSKI